eukprot:scaffold13577_cov135-Isochrysis_galbana.AAC.1
MSEPNGGTGVRCVCRCPPALTCGLDFHPPNAVPFQVRPVTNWKGRVEISCPAAATPMTTEVPQPRCEHSSAARITCG